jgi:hypothetical protein
MDLPNKMQDRITGYFTHGRHKNISCIYVAQRFFAIPKVIRENVNYISLHGGHRSLTDTKRIIRQYTEESKSLAPVIDNLTLQREFIIFDLRHSKTNPLSIRVRWDTSLRAISDQSQINHSSISDQSQINHSSISDRSQSDHSSISVLLKFTPYGQKAISEAKKNGWLLTFARNFPLPLIRKSSNCCASDVYYIQMFIIISVMFINNVLSSMHYLIIYILILYVLQCLFIYILLQCLLYVHWHTGFT